MSYKQVTTQVDDSEQIGAVPAAFNVSAVRIQNFKRIADTRIELAPVTYLVGGNNSGKSSVLQALHTAVSCAQTSVELSQKVVAEASLRYSPISDFSLLGHGAPYTNREKGHRGIVEFEGTAESGDKATYRIEMYKARNHNNVGVERSGTAAGFGQVISDPKKLFSVYVPGLAGVPHREQMRGYASVFRKAASGEANFVFRNIIRLLAERNLLGQLESLVGEVLRTDVSFKAEFNADRDLYVDIRLAAPQDSDTQDYLPVDLWGTGILQITQIFAYVLLFKPALLLVDEPDSHLHPSRQKSLGRALEEVADRFNCKVVVSTHSRHLITGASEAVEVVWMKDGRVESSNQRELTALLMDIGALDQMDSATKAVIYTEDANPKILENALVDAGYSPDSVKVVTYNGLNNAQVARAFQEMAEMMVSAPRVIVHRDRDFLSDEEVDVWGQSFIDAGVAVFCPKLCDTEAYCASVDHVANVLSLKFEEVELLRQRVIANNIEKLRSKFREKRRFANGNLWKDGGAPATNELWPDGEPPAEEQIYGKLLLAEIHKELKRRQVVQRSFDLSVYPCQALANELRVVLSSACEALVSVDD